MKIRFHGAARTVTGSIHVVEVNGDRILLDCGMFQGRRAEARRRNETLPVEPREVTSVVLSHAHIDHSGNLPVLAKRGYKGHVYATRATHDLCDVMLRDSARIQRHDADYINRKVEERGGEAVEPLYSEDDAAAIVSRFLAQPYHGTVEIARGVRARFFDAGHILGSAICWLEVAEGAKTTRVAFTGDLGRAHQPIIRDPERIPPIDVLITESTYGDRIHEATPKMKGDLEKIVARTAARGGKVIVPAFSVGRTQNLVYFLAELFREGRLPRIPIFIDSPLSANVTKVFRAHPECWDEETQTFLEQKQDPFGFSLLSTCETQEESKALNQRAGPFVVISASGMCEAGRILHHLKNHIGDSRNTVLIVGYQAENTLGRRIIERAPKVKIYGKEYPLRAEVVKMNGFSAHADKEELLAFVKTLHGSLRQVFVVHGEETQALPFAQSLRDRGFPEVHVPSAGDVFEA